MNTPSNEAIREMAYMSIVAAMRLLLGRCVFDHDHATAGTIGIQDCRRINLSAKNPSIASQAVLLKTDQPVVCWIEVRQHVRYPETLFWQKEVFSRNPWKFRGA